MRIPLLERPTSRITLVVARRALAINSQASGVRVWGLVLPALIQSGVVLLVLTRALGVRADMRFVLQVLVLTLVWSSFATAVLAMTSSYVDAGPLLKAMKVPPLALSGGTGLATASVFLIPLSLAGAAALATSPLSPWIALLPLALTTHAALLLSVGALCADGYALARPVRALVDRLAQIGYFATPIVYSLGSLPQPLRTLSSLNPVSGINELYRSSLFGHSPDLIAASWSVAVATTLTVVVVRRARHPSWDLADVL